MEQGRGRFCDNHGKGFFNDLGRVTEAKKIFSESDCENDRHRYYWEKVKSPYIYVRGFLTDDEDHPNARAAAAIMRNIHKVDCPLKMKASVEGGVLARGIRDESLLARTRIMKVALTFTPANNATLVEPLGLEKTEGNWEHDLQLIKSVMHLARTDVPSFRHITRMASAEKIVGNFKRANEMARQLGLENTIPEFTPGELVRQAAEYKIGQNIGRIKELTKALTAGYGGAGAPTGRAGGAVLQSEALDDGHGGSLKMITCDNCGDEQYYMKHQVKCRACNQSYSLKKLYPFLSTT